MTDRRFPIQQDSGCGIWGRQWVRGPSSVPWDEAWVAYESYSFMFGTSQTLAHLGERGGFGWHEYLALHATTWYMRGRLPRYTNSTDAHRYFEAWLACNGDQHP